MVSDGCVYSSFEAHKIKSKSRKMCVMSRKSAKSIAQDDVESGRVCRYAVLVLDEMREMMNANLVSKLYTVLGTMGTDMIFYT